MVTPELMVYSEFLLEVHIVEPFASQLWYKLVEQVWFYSMTDCQLAATFKDFNPIWGEAKGYIVTCTEHDFTKQYWQLMGGEKIE